MFLKSGYSFVAMLVINPVVILFYQQCSLVPVSYASKEASPPAIQRGIASSEPAQIINSSEKTECQNRENCIATKIK